MAVILQHRYHRKGNAWKNNDFIFKIYQKEHLQFHIRKVAGIKWIPDCLFDDTETKDIDILWLVIQQAQYYGSKTLLPKRIISSK